MILIVLISALYERFLTFFDMIKEGVWES